MILVIRNEERQIEECLKTISFADEIVVILDKCNDGSKKLLKNASNFYKGDWNIEGTEEYGINSYKENGFLR